MFIKKGPSTSTKIFGFLIIAANKKVKYPLLNITSGLFRCYIITLFGSVGEENMLKQLTGWSTTMLEREKIYLWHENFVLISINKIVQEKENWWRKKADVEEISQSNNNDKKEE